MYPADLESIQNLGDNRQDVSDEEESGDDDTSSITSELKIKS